MSVDVTARVYTTSVFGSQGANPDPDSSGPNQNLMADYQEEFRKFLLQFMIGSTFPYRDQLRDNVTTRQYFLRVSVPHLINYDEQTPANAPKLNQRLNEEPAEMVPVYEAAAKEVATRIAFAGDAAAAEEAAIPSMQLILDSENNPTSIRELNALNVAKLVRIPGIVISASALSSKATTLQLVCRNCKNFQRIDASGGIGTYNLPRRCLGPPVDGTTKNSCPPDPYVIVHDKSKFMDQQILKLQEAPEAVPVGELPRNIMLTVDRTLTNRVVPGTRCTVVGIYSIYQNKQRSGAGAGAAAVAIRNPYVRVLGIDTSGGVADRENIAFSDEEVDEFQKMAQLPDFYNVFARSIAPSIYGHEDIKRSIACLLVGGSRRILPDGMRLRGDINVLLMGDPGTAKSQLLKFVEKVAPVAIYTSGKGSSAAGLTASVQRDPQTRDFYLEGGAMVLADGGVVCIDEFDKMREDDRVAIHEAMEQQTISVAKAGITTVLNSRTSVLAAANPIFGRYDDTKTPGQNIDFQTTILSRFDMIYVIKDAHNDEYDQRVARHVMNTHIHGSQATQEVEGEIPLDKMKRYVSFCRARVAPKLSEAAKEKLSSHFVEIRRNLHEHERLTNQRSSVPITVRQLEALVRIAEAIAKLHLSVTVDETHVDEATRLFYASTMNAVNQDSNSQEMAAEVAKIEEELKRKLRVGYGAEYSTILREFVHNGRFNFNKHALDRALYALESRGTIQFRNQRQRVHRVVP